MTIVALPGYIARLNSEAAERDNLSAKTRAAIRKYGREICVKAYALHNVDGEGASTVGIYLSLTTSQANAAINAGREIDAKGNLS